ncbi:hypothetical protein MKEN_00180800 [Mycena kentingensis (nom. inval.)]|nr:hypothetical protein MKEN_00180800 [Mycena kentingensis (nom. inval.)]
MNFPNEMLLEVFCALPHADAVAAGFASRRFRTLAKPFIFPKLRVSFYTFDMESDTLRLPAPEETHDTLQKLAFYASRDIAPFLRGIKVNAALHAQHPDAARVPDGEAHVIADAFFAALPKFIGLRTINVHHAIFTKTALESLAMVVHRSITVSLYGCVIAPSLRLDCPLRIGTLEMYGKQLGDVWLSLLDPAVLRELTVWGVTHFPRFGAVPLPVFHNLTKLSLELDWRKVEHDLPILLQAFPAVTELYLEGWNGVPARLQPPLHGPRAFPNVLKMGCPHHALAVLLPCTSLVSLDVGPCTPNELSRSLGMLGPNYVPRTIVNLEIYLIAEGDRFLLRSSLEYFPKLQSLELIIIADIRGEWNDGAPEINWMLEVVSELPDTLPATLVKLDFRYELSNAPDDIPGSVVGGVATAPSPRELHTLLLERCSSLTDVSVTAGTDTKALDYSLVWTQTGGFSEPQLEYQLSSSA